jgi:peptidoglycan hydrolase-like amidase
VITHNKKIIKAWYFSSSDGKTLSYQDYCRLNGNTKCDDIAYLQSVDDPG